jgi:hypothetical protein
MCESVFALPEYVAPLELELPAYAFLYTFPLLRTYRNHASRESLATLWVLTEPDFLRGAMILPEMSKLQCGSQNRAPDRDSVSRSSPTELRCLTMHFRFDVMQPGAQIENP